MISNVIYMRTYVYVTGYLIQFLLEKWKHFELLSLGRFLIINRTYRRFSTADILQKVTTVI